MSETIIKIDPAYQYYISIPGHSWATFTFSDKGDFFINSDWGYWACNWRSFGDNFRKFLHEMNTSYLIGCLEREQLNAIRKKRIEAYKQEHLAALFQEFQRQLEHSY